MADETATRESYAGAIGEALRASTAQPWHYDRCGVWTADIVRAVTGRDPIEPWRGRYKTRRGMLRVLGPKGIPGAVANAAKRFGWKRIDPKNARIGDVGIVRGATGHAVVIRYLDAFVGVVPFGFSRIPADAIAADGKPVIIMAWNVAA